MIVENLYPTRTTLNVGETTGQYQVELTSGWGTTYDGETVNDISSYWLGWIRPENAPVEPCVGYYKDHGQTSETLTFEVISDEANCPCGYVNNSTTNYNDCERRILKQTVDGVETFNADSSYALYNQNYAMYSGRAQSAVSSTGYILVLGLKYCVYNAGNELIDPATHKEPSSISLSCGTDSMRGFRTWQFLQGNYDIPITKTYDGVTYTFMFNRDVLETGTGYIQDTTGTIFMRFFIYDVSLHGGVGMNGTSTSNVHPEFVYEISGTFGTHTCKYLSVGAGYPRWGNTYQEMYFEYDYRNNFPTEEDPRIRLGGLHGHFTATQLTAIRSDWDTPFVWDGNVFAYRHLQSGSGYYPQFRRVYSMSDIDKMYAYMYRMDVGSSRTAGYVANITYATNVLPTNEFLAEYKTGNLTDATFKNGLREWQYTDFKSDDFDEEDIPPYTPPEPEPEDDTPDDEPEDIDDAYGDGDEDQDDIVITAPSQFITQYILTASQLRTVGSNLWSSWVDPNTDVYKNFLFDFFQDTGTFNITAALDYIIALRVYPFSLAGMTTEYLGVSNGVYMGTGHTNFCPGTIPTLNTVIGYLDAGTLDVNLHVPYKDFRDLYNCSVMVFLPFCGTVELNPVEVIGKKLHAKYFIDFQSGACTAVIRVNNDGVEYTIASKSGQIGFMLPVSATNSGQLAAQYVNDATRAIGTLSGLFFDVASSVGRSAENAVKIMSAGEGGEESAPTGMTVTESLNIGKSGVKTALGFANQATDMLSRSGIDMPMLSGGAGAESLFMPPYVCLQVRRGKYAKPNNYPHSVGYYNLSSNPISYYKGAYQGSPSTGSNTGKGFCTFTGVDTSGLDCREDERAEILELLNTGIYL